MDLPQSSHHPVALSHHIKAVHPNLNFIRTLHTFRMQLRWSAPWSSMRGS